MKKHAVRPKGRGWRGLCAGMGAALAFITLATMTLNLATAPLAGQAQGDTAASTETGVFEFGQFNRSYTDLATDIAPIELSGITVQLDSPSHEMVVHANRLVLQPLASGSYDAQLTLRFSGRGQLLADIRMGGVPSRLEDELVVPEQTRELKLRARFARVAEGYLVTTEQMPEKMGVTMESRLGGNLLTVCRQVGLLLGLRCGSLEQAFSQVEVPLPEAGETYLVELDQVGPEGVRMLDAYLGLVAPAPQLSSGADAGSTP